MASASLIFITFLHFALEFTCLASLVTLYYVPTLSVFVLTSFCVALAFNIIYEIACETELVDHYGSLLRVHTYIINKILTLSNYMVYFGIFVITVYMFDHYDQTNHDLADHVASYLTFVAIYIFFQWFRDFVGAITEVYILPDGEVVSGRELDKNVEDKHALKVAKLVRFYVFRKPDSGISLGYNFPTVNFTHLFNPLPIVVGIALIVFANALKEHDALELSVAMDYIFNLISIGIIVHLCINGVLICMYTKLMCEITSNCKIHMFGLGVMAMLFIKNLYLYLITMFYKGFAEYLYEISIGGSRGLEFIFYVIACVATAIGLELFYWIMMKCTEMKIRKTVQDAVSGRV
ncbi:hypothetical protein YASMINEVIRUS_1451 [Yasminevirus sp. GU-2018]|uniref:Uncharacterized protein n=1 Tax=Yasminevirus sp. GU-2018 TaxID=2420051 RepID=A0A5K0U9Z9_9VIRU|nr:hypothetical protein YASMINEVIRUS_1451 [Yasminevirus sp. GU-2018]